MPYVRIRRKSLIRKLCDFERVILGEHIRRCGRMLSLTQEETAERLGVNAGTVINWETLQTKPAIQFIRAIIAFLGYNPEPIDEGTFAGRLVAKRRELGLFQREATRSLAMAGWELGARIARGAHRQIMKGFLGRVGIP